jgi:hypothetical protein
MIWDRDAEMRGIGLKTGAGFKWIVTVNTGAGVGSGQV